MIYFVRAEESGRIKIGTSTDPVKRLNGIKSGCPEPVTLLATMKGGPHEEKQVHTRFHRLRLRRRSEWFNPGDELLRFIKENAEPFEPPSRQNLGEPAGLENRDRYLYKTFGLSPEHWKSMRKERVHVQMDEETMALSEQLMEELGIETIAEFFRHVMWCSASKTETRFRRPPRF